MEFITILGGDSSKIEDDWMWEYFFKNYSHLKNEFELFFTKNPHGHAAYCMFKYCGSDQKWVEKLIKQIKDSHSAALMSIDCESDLEWAKRIIEETNDGYPASLLLAYKLVDIEWVKKIAEKDEKNIFIVYKLVYADGSNKKWGERLIEKSLHKDRNEAAYFMCKYNSSSKEWYKKVTGEEYS